MDGKTSPHEIIPRPEHSISRAGISENALKVLYRLHNSGYQAHLVGGGVRDLLLGREPKDFDVATDAHPEQVREVFRNCRLIGRRFRLAHVHFGREVIEVATFRGRGEAGSGEESESEGERKIEDGRLLRDNVYGTLDEDAWRRDFTVNALYYNIADFSVVDYTGGMEDLRNGMLRLIGDPEVRFREDPVRMLRAARFAAKLGFMVDPPVEAQMRQLAPLLEDMPPARLYEEVLKLFLGGVAVQTFEILRKYDLFAHLFPATDAALGEEPDGVPQTFVARALENTDRRLADGKPVTPAFLYAALLWEPVRARATELIEQGMAEMPAIQQAGAEVLSRQLKHISIPKRFSFPMREIWALQYRLPRRGGKRPFRTLSHPRFRAAYDFLLLRSEVGEADPELAQWWTEFQQAEGNEQAALVTTSDKPRRRRRRRRPAE